MPTRSWNATTARLNPPPRRRGTSVFADVAPTRYGNGSGGTTQVAIVRRRSRDRVPAEPADGTAAPLLEISGSSVPARGPAIIARPTGARTARPPPNHAPSRRPTRANRPRTGTHPSDPGFEITRSRFRHPQVSPVTGENIVRYLASLVAAFATPAPTWRRIRPMAPCE
jgi:hypothetical protein